MNNSVASERSVVKKFFNGKKTIVVGMQTAVDMKADIALFSAGGETFRVGSKVCCCWNNRYR
jgi:hypothetical protein